MADLPSVSALVAAYNYERYVERAVCSALAQDYPPELLEVVVVDDGSTDATSEVVKELAARHPERRIRLVRQANSGQIAATNRAIAEAGGDVLALLDADDEWLPGKIRSNVEMLTARPQLGLVFSDMAIVDADNEIVAPSLFAWAWQDWRPPRGRTFARLLAENFATASSITVRAGLREVFEPIPDAIPYADWWLAVAVSRVAELDYSDQTLARYRLHGSNLTGGVSGVAALRERRKDLAFQLWCLRNLPLDELGAPEALSVWEGVERKARLVLAASPSAFVVLSDTGQASRAATTAGAGAAGEAGARDPHELARLALRALANDPYGERSRDLLVAAAREAQARDALPDPLAGSRPIVALADAEELLGDDDLLRAFAAALSGAAEVTLAIDASRLAPARAVGELRAMVDRCGLGDRDDVHLVAVVGELHPSQRERMLAGAHAFYSREERPRGPARTLTPSTLHRLREAVA
jgi:hypothetical protein